MDNARYNESGVDVLFFWSRQLVQTLLQETGIMQEVVKTA